ncbi:hypothetical protein ACHAQJ_001888 [Trichoderma viride]
MRGPFHIRTAITGFLSLLSLSTTTLATTNLIPHKPPARLLAQILPSSPFQDAAIIVAAAAEQCHPGELVCNAGCMPPRSECCADGNGYCKQGYACVTDGCCPIGKTCSDQISCGLGEEPCGDNKCMPDGAVCCPNGAYCHAGEQCFQNGFEQYCRRVSQSGGPHSTDANTTTGGTKTSGTAKATSSRDQSTTKRLSSKTSQEETWLPASTSSSLKSTSSEHETSKPIVLPTFHLPSESSTSSSVTSDTSSSTPGPTTTSPSNGNNAAAVIIPGLELTLALGLVFIAFIGL